MNAICLFVAGTLRATLATTDITVAWDHSVEKTRWEERYRVDGDRLQLVEVRIQGSGAGMDPPPDATLVDGWWTWRPGASLAVLRLTASSFTRDYDLCWRGRCETLHRVIGAPAELGTTAPIPREQQPRDAPAVVDIRACAGMRALR